MTSYQKKEIEKILREYVTVVTILRIKKKMHPHLPEIISAIDNTKIKTSPTHNIQTLVENRAVEKVSYWQDIDNLIKLKDIVEAALNGLTTEERQIIILRYFNKQSVSNIALEIDRSRMTIYCKCRSAAEKLLKVGLIDDYTKIRQKLDTFLTDSINSM